MSKLAEQLRAIGVSNNHLLLLRFGDEPSIAVEYHSGSDTPFQFQRAIVYSPHWRDGNCGRRMPGYDAPFPGRRSKSMPEAIAWASKEYGITEWANSPFGGKIPASVLKRAKQAVKEAKA